MYLRDSNGERPSAVAPVADGGRLGATTPGLTSTEAARVLRALGPNEPARLHRLSPLRQLVSSFANPCNAQVDTKWEIHERNRPVPPVVDPGTVSTQDAPGRPPADAVVLLIRD